MKVLQVIHFFSPLHGGGSIEVARQQSRALAQRGHEVVIFTSDFELDREYTDSLQGIKVRLFHSWLSWRGLYFTPGMAIALNREIGSFDIVHLHGIRGFHNIAVHHYANKYGVPYVVQAHGSLETFYQKGKIKQVFTTIWGNRIAKHASRLIALSDKEVEQYKRMGVSEEKVEIVPNGVDLSEFADLPARGSFRRKYSMVEENDNLILYLGRINRGKGIDLLVRAFARLSRELDNVKLAIVGPDDGYLFTLRKLIGDLGINQDRILLTGPMYGKDKLEAYVDADVLALPCAFEPFGLVLLEACACGTPVVFSKDCGVANVLNGRGGLAIAYDEGELLNALIRILSDDEMRRQLGERGRALVNEQFGVPKTVDRLEQLYQACLEGEASK